MPPEASRERVRDVELATDKPLHELLDRVGRRLVQKVVGHVMLAEKKADGIEKGEAARELRAQAANPREDERTKAVTNKVAVGDGSSFRLEA